MLSAERAASASSATAGSGRRSRPERPTSLAHVADELASGALYHYLAFERDVGLASPVPSGLGDLQADLDAPA